MKSLTEHLATVITLMVWYLVYILKNEIISYLKLIMPSYIDFDHFQVLPVIKFSVVMWHAVKDYLNLLPCFVG